MTEGSTPTTRLSTELAADCWIKRVTSLCEIEKPCQLMMAPGVLVIVSRLPCWLKSALPLTTAAPVGFAIAVSTETEKHAATASEIALALSGDRI